MSTHLRSSMYSYYSGYAGQTLAQLWSNVQLFGFTALVIDPHYQLNLDLKHGNQNYAYRLKYELTFWQHACHFSRISNKYKLMTLAQRWPKTSTKECMICIFLVMLDQSWAKLTPHIK